MGHAWDLMYDIIRLAFQSDQTRVASLLLGQRRQQHSLSRSWESAKATIG